jgi:hypothetical protein
MVLDHERFPLRSFGPQSVIHASGPRDQFPAGKRHCFSVNGYVSIASQANNINVERRRVLVNRRVLRESKICQYEALSLEQNAKFDAD